MWNLFGLTKLEPSSPRAKFVLEDSNVGIEERLNLYGIPFTVVVRCWCPILSGCHFFPQDHSVGNESNGYPNDEQNRNEEHALTLRISWSRFCKESITFSTQFSEMLTVIPLGILRIKHLRVNLTNQMSALEGTRTANPRFLAQQL